MLILTLMRCRGLLEQRAEHVGVGRGVVYGQARDQQGLVVENLAVFLRKLGVCDAVDVYREEGLVVDVDLKYALISIGTGVVIAGCIVMGITYGFISI